MTPNECRAARALLDLTQGDLALNSKIGLSSIVDFEKQRRGVSAPLAVYLQATFERLGIDFVKVEGAAGVKLRGKNVEGWVGIHPLQLKAARALLDWNQAELALAANVSRETIRRLERPGTRKGYISTMEQVSNCLRKAKIEFIDGPGVLLTRR